MAPEDAYAAYLIAYDSQQLWAKDWLPGEMSFCSELAVALGLTSGQTMKVIEILRREDTKRVHGI